MEEYKEIIELLDIDNSKYPKIEVLRDIIIIFALIIKMKFDYTDKDEKTYEVIVSKYEKSESKILKKIMDKISQLYEGENELRDILGEIFQDIGGTEKFLDNKFFTPMPIANIMPNTIFDIEKIKNKEFTTVYDAECASGAMLLGAANYFKKSGLDYKEKMYVYAEETESICAYITYIQLTLYDIPGRVLLLSKNRDKVSEAMYTPRHYTGNWNEKLKNE